MSKIIHLRKHWPEFRWENDQIISRLAAVRHKQGRLLGKIEAQSESVRNEVSSENLCQDIICAAQMEGETLPKDQVALAIGRRLRGYDKGGLVPDRPVEGATEVALDATRFYEMALTEERLLRWHAALFPVTRGTYQQAARWRTNLADVSFSWHADYEPPHPQRIDDEIRKFLKWFNKDTATDPILKAAIAHFWFVTILPFNDGNLRIANAITTMQLCRADGERQRFYSFSAQIVKERSDYLNMLESTQNGNLDITPWLVWFIERLEKAISFSEQSLSEAIQRSHRTSAQVVSLNERQRSLLANLSQQPEGKLTTSKWATLAQCSTDTALRDIQDLIKKGILEKEEGGGRSTCYSLKS